MVLEAAGAVYRLPVDAKLGCRVGILPSTVHPPQDDQVPLDAESGITLVTIPFALGPSDGLQSLDCLGLKTCHCAIYHDGLCNMG